jgi:hypothetical protein
MLIRGLQAGQVNNSQTQGQEHSTSRAGSFVFLPRAQVPVLSRRPPVGRCRSPSRAASKTAFTRPTPPPLTMSVSGSVSATASTSFRMNRRAREGSPCPTQRRSTRSARHNGLPVGQRRERIAADQARPLLCPQPHSVTVFGLQAVPLTDDRPGRSSSLRCGRSTWTAVAGRQGIAATNEGGRWTKSVAVDHDLMSSSLNNQSEL